MGGMVAAIERGYPQREIAESAYRFQQDVERGRQVIVGVNEFVSETPSACRFCALTKTRRSGSSTRSTGFAGRATGAGHSRARAGCEKAAAAGGQYDAGAAGRRARVRDGRRDVRRAPRGLGRVSGAGDNLDADLRTDPIFNDSIFNVQYRSVSSSPSLASTGTIGAPR